MEDPAVWIGKNVTSLPTPAFVVDISKVKKNCSRMQQKCLELGIKLRPHVKTHKTLEGALLQTAGKRESIVVSTVAEAAFYFENGFDDIVIGRPVTPKLVERCAPFLKKKIIFLVNSEEGADSLIKLEGSHTFALLKISAGYQRAGIPWYDISTIINLSRKLNGATNVSFVGLYTHCGNSYSTNRETVVSVRDETVERILHVRSSLLAQGIPCQDVGIGSTPSCSLPISPEMRNLTEIHAGNYVFYDCQQESYGSCERSDIACRIMTRIVSHNPNHNQLIVDLGFTGITKQGLDLAVPGYGSIEGHPELKLIAMSQELGTITTVGGEEIDFTAFPVDSPLFVFPYHSCASAGVHPFYYIHDENQIVSQVWRPVHGW